MIWTAQTSLEIANKRSRGHVSLEAGTQPSRKAGVRKSRAAAKPRTPSAEILAGALHDIPKIALLIETSNAYARGLLEGVQDYVRAEGPWNIYFAEHGRGDEPPEWLRSWKGDGIIARIENGAIADAVKRCGLPSVDVSAAHLLPELPCVETDDEAFARVALEHFVERGFQNFAFCGDSRFRWSDLRGAYFSAFVNEQGETCEMFRSASRPDSEAHMDELARWVCALPKPVAVFACYDALGRQVLDACRRAGLSVPEQVAVLGVDNEELLSELSSPPLSSIVPNARRAGWEAAALLAQTLQGQEPDTRPRLLPPLRVAVRQSTDVLAVADPQIVRALQIIRKKACKGVEVEEVARRAGLSRRLLEIRFRSILGRAPHEEIMRVRLERVKELLSLTDLPLAEIADRAGFRYVEYLSATFKKKLGVTPGAYRAKHQRQRRV